MLGLGMTDTVGVVSENILIFKKNKHKTLKLHFFIDGYPE